jgi:hypothetical protein
MMKTVGLALFYAHDGSKAKCLAHFYACDGSKAKCLAHFYAHDGSKAKCLAIPSVAVCCPTAGLFTSPRAGQKARVVAGCCAPEVSMYVVILGHLFLLFCCLREDFLPRIAAQM